MYLFTFIHVALSLIGIISGFFVVLGLIANRWLTRCTSFFLATTSATSVTGFLFPVHHFMPSHAVGILSLIALGIATYALFSQKLSGGWRKAYVISAVVALYFNFFVLIAQLFAKVPALHALAPTQSEPPFAVAQGFALVLFVWLGIRSVRGFTAPLPLPPVRTRRRP
jgi:hypothetical protein